MKVDELIKKRKHLSNEKYAKIWREHYDSFTCNDQIKIQQNLYDYQGLIEKEPEEVSNFRKDTSLAFFEYIFLKKEKIRVLEFGGGFGYLANYILKNFHDHIEEWTNYEITPYALTYNACHFPQYTVFLCNKFFWELDFKKDYDVFVSVHSIEHIKGFQLAKVFESIKDIVDFMYLESPICDDSMEFTPAENVNGFFVNCGALHILELGWEQILEMISEFKVLETISVPYVLNRKKNIVAVFYKGVSRLFQIPINYALRIPGQGFISFNSKKANGGVRCLEKIAYDKEKLCLEKEKFAQIVLKKEESVDKNPFLIKLNRPFLHW